MKNVFLSIFLFVLIFSSKTLLAHSSSKDTVRKNNAITKDLVLLPSLGNFIYVLPPEPSFTRDTNRIFLGLSSEKYPGVAFTFILRGDGYEDDENILKEKYKILKQEVMRINDTFDLWYYKLSPKENPDLIIWSVFFENPFFYGNAMFSYTAKDDNILGEGMERTINSFVIIQSPDITPKANVVGIGDFESIPLKFVKKRSFPVTYYTEDGLPMEKTKGSKIFAFATGPRSNNEVLELPEAATIQTNTIFKTRNIEDSVIVETVEPTTMLELDGIKISGSLASNSKRSFISYYVKYLNKPMFFLVFGICNNEDKKEFDKILDNFRKTVNINTER